MSAWNGRFFALGLATHYHAKGQTRCGTIAPPSRLTTEREKVSCIRCSRLMRRDRKR